MPLNKYKSIGGIEHQNLRYGENPHQKATFYNDGSNVCGLITANQIQGIRILSRSHWKYILADFI